MYNQQGRSTVPQPVYFASLSSSEYTQYSDNGSRFPTMASRGFPDSHTTTTTITHTTTKVTPAVRFDKSYVFTLPGILKCAQVLDNFIGFICVQVSYCNHCPNSNWFSFVSMTAFWVTLVLLVFYLFHLIERLHVIPWLLGECIYCAVWTIFYFIAALIMAINGGKDSAWAASAFFGFVALGLYGFDAFLKYRGWRNGELAQGVRTVTTTSPEATSPTSPSYPY